MTTVFNNRSAVDAGEWVPETRFGNDFGLLERWVLSSRRPETAEVTVAVRP